MAWNRHAIEQTQLRRQHRVEGVGRPKLDFRTGRVWKKSVQYDVRKNFADTRLRVKGRFVKKEDEVLLKELVGLA